MRAFASRAVESNAPSGVQTPDGGRHRRLTLLVMCVSTFMIQLDVTVVNVALPRIQADLGLGATGLEWVISAYALGLAAGIPVGGALGDHYGRRRVFLLGVVVFALGSGACALSPNGAVLIVARAVQGLGGAPMLALTLSILTEAIPPRQRAAAIGTWASIGGTGFGVGPVVGGILLSNFDWASVFWINVPLALVAVVGTSFAVAESRNLHSRGLDRAGAVSSALGLAGVTGGLVESASHDWSSLAVCMPLITGAGLLVAFGWWQTRAADPMVPPVLARARSFVSAGGVYLISYTAFAGALFYVTLLYQDVLGWSVLRTGLTWLFMNVPFLVAAQLAGRLDRRFAVTRVVCCGCLSAAAGFAALSLAGPSTWFAWTAGGFALAGAGFGLLVPGITHVAMRDVPSGASGAASAVLNSCRQIGTSLGLAVLGAIGASAATHGWDSALRALPAAVRGDASAQGQQVAAGRIGAVVGNLGGGYRQPAVHAFVHGYHLAVGTGAACLLLAAVIAVTGLDARPKGAPRMARR